MNTCGAFGFEWSRCSKQFDGLVAFGMLQCELEPDSKWPCHLLHTQARVRAWTRAAKQTGDGRIINSVASHAGRRGRPLKALSCTAQTAVGVTSWTVRVITITPHSPLRLHLRCAGGGQRGSS